MDAASFASILRTLRRKRGYTQNELAERAGLSVRTISDLERGIKASPRLATVRLLGSALEGGADELATLLAAATPDHQRDPARAQLRSEELPDASSTIHLDIRYARRTDGARTAYGVTGRGPSLLIPPGLISHLEWYETAPGIGRWLSSLARNRTLVLYDRHGCGLSDRDRSDFTAIDDMRDIEAVAETLATGSFDVFGSSWGTHPAIMFAARYPHRVRRLLLYAPTLLHSPAGASVGSTVRSARLQGSIVDRRLALAALRRTDLELYVRTVAMMFFPDDADSDLFWSFVSHLRTAATIEMQEQLDLVQFDLEPLLEKISSPTLVTHRRGDRACPFEIGQYIAARISGARFVPLEGQSHFPWVGDWQSVADVIREFLDAAPVV